MKLRVLAAAVTAASASQAFALGLADLDNTVIEIYQSGASAQQETMQSLLTEYCQAGSLDVFVDADDEWRNFFCRFETTANNSAIPASLSGEKVLFYTRADGGSVWGVVPLGKQWNVKFLDLDACVGASTNSDGEFVCPINTESAAAPSGVCPLDSGDYSADDADSRCRIPDFGVSDVEPDLFVGNNLSTDFTSGLTAAEAATLTVSSNYGVVFGVSVSNNVRDALIAEGYSIDATDSGATAPNISGGQVANLSKTAIRSLMAGNLTNWSQLDSALAGTSFGGYMMACRRAPGSGTQASAQIQFLDDPCHNGGKGGLVSMVTADSTTGDYLVFENSGSSGVERCQNDANNAGNTQVDTQGFEWGAWGINAINRNQSGDDWSFVAIDGVYPTLERARTGEYDHVYEQTTQYQTSISGAQGDFVRLFAQEFQVEQRILDSGATGVVAIPGVAGNTFPGTTGLVARVTRGGNSCASMRIVQ